MRRDTDYVRQLLFQMEQDDDFRFFSGTSASSNEEEEKEHYHLLLMEDAGLTERVTLEAHSFRLTNHGHDFIDVIRSDTAWNKVKRVGVDAGGATLKMLGEIAVQIAKRKLADTAGIEI